MADDARDDDGLPLDPTARAAAVARQFDESFAGLSFAGLKQLDERAPGRLDADDALRLIVARELVGLGVEIDSLPSLFDSLQTASTPRAKPWAWLRTEEARLQGAALVLFRPVRASACGIGAACVTTAATAVEWLRSKRGAIVIDIGAIIQRIEHATGQSYVTPPTTERRR